MDRREAHPKDKTGTNRTARAILEYLREHPGAQDTVEGIVEWWLLERRIRQGAVEVEAALVELVGAGVMEARRGADGRTHYRLNAGFARGAPRIEGTEGWREQQQQQ